MGNVVSSQESRHQVGDGPSLPTVRPEEEGAQTSFPAEQMRQALGQQGPLVHTAQDPTGWDLHPQFRATPGETGTMAGEHSLHRPLPKSRGQAHLPQSQERPSLGNSRLPCPPSSPPLPSYQACSPIHRPSEQGKL